MAQPDEYEQQPVTERDDGESGVYDNDGQNLLDVSFNATALADSDTEMHEYERNTYFSRGHRSPHFKIKQDTFSDKAGAAFRKYNWVNTVVDARDTMTSRMAKPLEARVPWAVLTEGVPETWHGMIVQERERYGEVAALTKRDQLRETLETNRSFDSMDGFEQFGFGALAMVADPVNLAGLGVLGVASKASSAAFKGVQAASIINAGVNGGRAWAASGLVSNSAKISGWAALGGAEGAIMNVPQLAKDPTYTATDYMLDIAFDSALGIGFGGISTAWNKKQGLAHTRAMDDANRKLQEDLQRRADPVKSKSTAAQEADVDALGKNVANQASAQASANMDLPTRIQTDIRAIRSQIREARKPFATPETTALEAERKVIRDEARTLAAQGEKADKARMTELRTRLTKLDNTLKEHYKLTDTDDIKKQLAHANELTAELKSSKAPSGKPHAEVQLSELYKEMKALKKEHLDLLVAGEVVPAQKIDLSQYEMKVKNAEAVALGEPTPANLLSVKDAKAKLAEAKQQAAMPTQNSVPVDKNEVRRREIRLRLDELTRQRNDLVKEEAPKVQRTYATLSDITNVSKQVFDGAVLAVQGKFKKNSAMYSLINRHQKLLREKALSVKQVTAKQEELSTTTDENVRRAIEEELRANDALERLSADILRLLHSLPSDGVPEWLEDAVREATHKQTHFTHKNIFDGLLNNGVSNPEQALQEYVDTLERMNIWAGYDPQPVTASEFYRENSAWLNPDIDEAHMESGDLDYMQTYVSKELSYLRDVVKLNEYVKDKPELKPLVEKINGYTLTRLEQKEREGAHFLSEPELQVISEEIRDTLREWGYIKGTNEWVDKFGELYRNAVEVAKNEAKMPGWKDSRESWGKTVRMTPDDAIRQVKREGYTKGTPEYKARLKELLASKGRVAVPEEVNVMGKRQSFVIGTDRTDALDRDELSRTKDHYAGGSDEFATNFESEDTPVRERSLDLVVDEPDAGLLPRHVTTMRTVSVYDTPTLENIARMRDLIRTTVVKRAEALAVKTAITETEMVRRLESIIRGVARDKQAIMRRAINSKNLDNIVDVLRAAEMVAQDARRVEVEKPATPKKEGEAKAEPTVKEQIEEAPPTVLTEEALEQLNPKITTKAGITPVEQGIIERDVLRGVEEAEREAAEVVSKLLVDHVANGADDTYKEAMKPKGWVDSIGRMLASWTQDLGERFLKSDLVSLRFVGTNLVETGAGFGGGARRKGTAALIRESVFRKSVSPMIMRYRDMLERYAHSQNATAPEVLYAMENAGVDSGITARFNRLIYTEIENRKQGNGIRSTEPGIAEFADEWKKYMDSNHDQLVDARIEGFTKQRKVDNYIPHIWKYHLVDKAVREHGYAKVQSVLAKGYLTSSQVDKVPLSEKEALDKAYDLLTWIREQANMDGKAVEIGEDPFMPVLDSRARSRAEINTLAEVDGLSVMDLLDTDVVGNGIRYSNRLAGWVSLSKATDGKLTSHRKIGALRKFIDEESREKGADHTKNTQLFDDTIEMLFGRPTRGGIAPELRMLKDMTALTRMGGLGTAQLIESGQVIARSTLNLFSDPTTVKNILKSAKIPASENDLLNELQTFTGIRDDMEFLERQSVHLDQEDLHNVGLVRKASLWAADKATFGSLKAPASRLLGKTTGFNMIRRAQTRVNQMSFITDVANHFKNGTGKMGNARMADLGLTEVDGTDVELQDMFKRHAEYDANGQLKKLNIQKWSQSARDKLNLAMIRDDAQNIQRTMIGELPYWMNSPMMSLLMQFREMPLVAMNKSLRRSMAFADKEAVVGFMLNATFAGLVRWSKFAALGYMAAELTDSEWVEPTQEKMDTAKYITQFGMYPDMYDLVLDSRKAIEDSDIDKVMNTIPVLGLMQDYSDATGITEEQRRTQLDSVQGLTPLGNTAYGDAIFIWLNEKFGE